MFDRVGKEVLVMLVAIALSFVLGGPVGAAICFALAAMIALVLWTPLRGWLGIPAKGRAVQDAPAGRVGYHGAPGSTATFRNTRFGTGLDKDILNEGDIDVDGSDVE